MTISEPATDGTPVACPSVGADVGSAVAGAAGVSVEPAGETGVFVGDDAAFPVSNAVGLPVGFHAGINVFGLDVGLHVGDQVGPLVGFHVGADVGGKTQKSVRLARPSVPPQPGTGSFSSRSRQISSPEH